MILGIAVNTERESELVQRALFEIGFEGLGVGKAIVPIFGEQLIFVCDFEKRTVKKCSGLISVNATVPSERFIQNPKQVNTEMLAGAMK